MMWFRFYSGALDDPKVQRLTGDLFKVWVNLLCLANESEERGTLPSNDDIAFRLRLDDQQAADALRVLIRAGLLDQDEDGALHIHGWEARQKKSDDVTARVHKHRGVDPNRETLPKRFSNGLEKSREDTEENRPEQSRADPPTPQEHRQEQEGVQGAAASAPPLPDAGAVRPLARSATKKHEQTFAAFWQAWPKKEARPKALAAWCKIGPDPDTVQAILDAIPRHMAIKDWPREGWRYCPHPATWLNERRWEDELPDVVPRPFGIVGRRHSNDAAKWETSLTSLQNVGGNRGTAHLPDQHGEDGSRLLRRIERG